MQRKMNEIYPKYDKETGKEIRVYIIECKEDYFGFRKYEGNKNLEPIKKEAEKRGTVYSLYGFQEAVNNEEIGVLTNSYILID